MSPFSLLPALGLFALPVADTRSPLSVVTLRWDDGFGIDATLGASFPVVAYTSPAVDLQLGVEAGGFMGFDPDGALTFDLETFDGLFAFPLSARRGPWSARLEWAHVSAHFADGVRDDGALPGSGSQYSREWLRLLAGRDVGPARVYAGGRVLLHDARDSAPLAVQVGGEVFGPWTVAPYLAADLQLAQEFAWQPAVGAQLGVAVPTKHARLRVAAAVRHGPDDTGKLDGAPESFLGLSFGFDLGGGLAHP